MTSKDICNWFELRFIISYLGVSEECKSSRHTEAQSRERRSLRLIRTSVYHTQCASIRKKNKYNSPRIRVAHWPSG